MRVLHVANGTSTTGTIQAAGIPGTCSIWADPLYEGPVPAGLSDAELIDVRTRYLSGPSSLTWSAWSGNDPPVDPRNDLRAWRTAILNHDSYDELILWFEHDVFDQLNLVQLLAWIRERVPATKTVSLICIGSFPGRAEFKGLGELTTVELASLLETRQPVSAPHYDLARRAWDAFRQPEPSGLDDLRRGDTSAFPYLEAAITRFLQEYPWTGDGLSRTERRLLAVSKGDGIALWNAFPRMHDGERAYYVTDASVAALAEMLSRTSPPLLTLDTTSAPEGGSLRGVVALTDTGRSVLAGQLDRIEVCGIDRWLGGVHLQEGHRIWRWDEARQRIM